jgi:ABC-type sugar transport system ATPase subunit
VYITGRLANYVQPKERDVAMVFQNYALYPHMTIETNLAFPLKMRKLPREAVARRVAEIAELLGLGELLKRYPQQLSGGQRQRVALGRAIIREPVAFLMDEPLSNLDALLRVQMRTELLKLHRRVGKTTIYVTHDQVEAMTMANRIVILKDGVVQQVGSTTDVYDRPANTFVATFVGSPPMNLFPGHLANGAGRRSFVGAFTTLVAGDWPTVDEDAEVTLGIRPEHIELAPADGAAVRGTVELVEAVGAESYLSINLGAGLTCMVRAAGRTRIRDGEQVGLVFPDEATHLFASDKTLIDRPDPGEPAPR